MYGQNVCTNKKCTDKTYTLIKYGHGQKIDIDTKMYRQCISVVQTKIASDKYNVLTLYRQKSLQTNTMSVRTDIVKFANTLY